MDKLAYCLIIIAGFIMIFPALFYAYIIDFFDKFKHKNDSQK